MIKKRFKDTIMDVRNCNVHIEVIPTDDDKIQRRNGERLDFPQYKEDTSIQIARVKMRSK